MGSKPKTPPGPVEAPNNLLSNSRIKILDLISEGPISGFAPKSGIYGNDPLVSVLFDDVYVRNLDGSYNFNASGQGFLFNYNLGNASQSILPGFDKVQNIVPLSSNTKVANPPAGAGSQKNVVVSLNSETYPDAASVKITVKVPTLLTQDEKGNTNGFSIHYAVEISLNNGPFVVVDLPSIVGKCTSPYLKTTIHTLPKTTPPQDYYEWKVRVRRTSTNIQSLKTQNELFVDSIAVISNSSFTYPNTALVGVELSAEQFAGIPARAYEVMGMLVSVPQGYTPTTYNSNNTITPAVYPNIWNGAFAASKRWTDNPAWIFYDILTNKRYGLGNYIKEDWIDKWSLYEIAQYCDELVDDGRNGLEPRFTCNIVIQSRNDAYQLLLNLASVFRGILYWANGRLISNGTMNSSPLYQFTNANVINGEFNYSDTAKNTRSTVIKVRWTDPENLYRESIEYVEDLDSILKYGYIEKDITAFACTSKGQAIRIGNWVMQTEKNLTETVSFQVGLEGNMVKPGDIFNIYDNYRNSKQQGGRVSSFNPARTEIALDRPVNLDAGYTYMVSVIAPKLNLEPESITGSNQIPQIRSPQIENRLILGGGGSGLTGLTVNTAFSTDLNRGAIWLISTSGDSPSYAHQSSLYRCLTLSETAEKTMQVLAVEYNTGVNSFSETGYTSVTSPINSGSNEAILPPSNLVLSLVTGLYSNNSFYSYLTLVWNPTPSTNLAYYRLSGQAFGGTFENFADTTSTGGTYGFTVTGLHNFKVGAVSYGGVHSSYISASYTAQSTNPLGGPPALTGLQISEDFDPVSSTTGYVGVTPTVTWYIQADTGGNLDPKYSFFSGYNMNILNPNTNVSVLPSLINITDEVSPASYELSRTIFNNFVGGPRRDIKIAIESVDIYGNKSTGASIVINNPPPNTGLANATFLAFGQNLQYSISPHFSDADISGLFLWYNTGSITPTFANKNFTNSNLAGFTTTALTGAYNVWWSLIDSFGQSGCQIVGPVTVNPTVGVTGIASCGGVFVNEDIRLCGTGNIKITQQGSRFYFSGERDYFNLSFYVDSIISGLHVGEAIISKNFILTGYAISVRNTGTALTGRFYTDTYNNTNKTVVNTFILPSNSAVFISGDLSIPITGSSKIGFDLLNNSTSSKLSLGLFGYDVN
jgi:hypothetical protein